MRFSTLPVLGAAVLSLMPLTNCSGTDNNVLTVIDGDTLDLQSGQRVRLLGIDAPETGHDQTPAQCGADAATQRLADLVADRHVKVITDAAADQTDRYGRTLAYLEVDGRDVAVQLLEEGLVAAWKPASAAKPARWRHYADVELAARTSRRGSWATCGELGR